MAQSVITSFFKRKHSPVEKDDEKESIRFKPPKKRLRIESTDEENDLIETSLTTSETVKNSKDTSSTVKITKSTECTDDDIKQTRSNNINTDSSSSKRLPIILGKQTKIEDCTDNNSYDPANSSYDPINDAFWKGTADTPYLALARCFEQIESTKGRIKMIEILGNFFCSLILLNPEDLLPSVYLSVNQIAPAYEGIELGVAEVTLMKAICKSTGRDLKYIKIQTQKIGDLGIVAEQSRVAQQRMFHPVPLTIKNVFKKLSEISKISGPTKMTIIQDILVACRFSEARYLIRSLIGKLRIGIAEQSMIYALASALTKASMLKQNETIKKSKKTPDEIKAEINNTALILRTAYCQCPNYDQIIPTLLKYGISELLTRCPMKPGVPIKPMLAQPTKGVHEVLQRFEGLHITCEWKYDGERAQIHRNDDFVVNIYSRNQENNTAKYPDVISRISPFVKDGVGSFIIDSEIVAWDVERKQILPFQVLSTRKRKNVSIDTIKVQVCVYVFDLLYLNGNPLVSKTFAERRELLKSNFQEIEGVWKFAEGRDTNDLNEVEQFLEDSIKGNCEGLMVKTLDKEATYEIAKRSRNWLKLKKDYMSSIGDSLDLVVIGAYSGKGKRTGIYGGFLLACYDEENEEYQSICKIGTGFSDEVLASHTDFLKDHTMSGPKLYYRFDTSLKPDVWIEPVQVWEIKCADLSLSPVHRAAIGICDPERGISLRFPRFIRIRNDKSPEQATSAQQISFMYSSQDQIKNNQNAGILNNDFEDFY